MRQAATELRKTLAELNFDETHAANLTVGKRLEYFRTILAPKRVGEGRHRHVYGVNGHYVVKVPADAAYRNINTAEWNIFRRRQRAGSKWSLPAEPAKCCMVKIAGTKLLVMERLSSVCTPDNKRKPRDWPKWVYRIDCCQCGKDRDGKVVAFDYGTDGGAFKR